MSKIILSALRNRRIQIIPPLVGLCVFLLTIRIARSGSIYYIFLAWNIFLAAIPLFASSMLGVMEKRNSLVLFQLGCFCLWLLFLPNAPYIITDLIHLKPRPPVPLWYDLALIISCAGTGLLMGYLSLVDVHAIIGRKFGTIAGWMVAIGSLLLTGFGIYLGRFVRLNSWDVATDPMSVLGEIAGVLRHSSHNSPSVGVTLIFGAMLALWYIAMRLLTGPTAPQGNR